MSKTGDYKQVMDDAATDAENDLATMSGDHDEAIQLVADWWASWFMKAGHKRLARILLQYKSKVAK